MFIFDATEILSFKEFSNNIEKEKKFFNESRKSIFDKYEILKPVNWNYDIITYQKFRDEYRQLVQTIKKDVISLYRNKLPKKLLISEFGSFVKRTERIFSDIDLTFCYEEEKTKEYEVVEEIIDYTLASVFKYSIDHVHGNFQHYPDRPEFDKYTEEDNLYVILFNDGRVEYKCGPETLSENLANIKNPRDYKTLLGNFQRKYRKKINIDCLYSMKIIENTTDNNLIDDLALLEKNNDICAGYKFNLTASKLNNLFTISQLKRILKIEGMVEFYIFISKLRKIVSISNQYSMNIEMLWNNEELINLFGKEYMDNLHIAFITFIFYWNRIEISLWQRKIPLSTRCYKEFTKNEINCILENDWGKGTDIDKIISSKNQITSFVQKGLEILNWL